LFVPLNFVLSIIQIIKKNVNCFFTSDYLVMNSNTMDLYSSCEEKKTKQKLSEFKPKPIPFSRALKGYDHSIKIMYNMYLECRECYQIL